jgi:hypothetical protein
MRILGSILWSIERLHGGTRALPSVHGSTASCVTIRSRSVQETLKRGWSESPSNSPFTHPRKVSPFIDGLAELARANALREEPTLEPDPPDAETAELLEELGCAR